MSDDLTLRLLLAWTRVPDGRKTRRGLIEAAGRMKAARPPSGAAFVIPCSYVSPQGRGRLFEANENAKKCEQASSHGDQTSPAGHDFDRP